MITNKISFEDLIDWPFVKYDPTKYDLLNEERLVTQIGQTNCAIILSEGNGNMGKKVNRGKPHVDNWWGSERATDTGKHSKGPTDAKLFTDIEKLADIWNKEKVLFDVNNIFATIPSRFQEEDTLDPDPEVIQSIKKLSKNYGLSDRTEYNFTYLYILGISEENKYYLHGEKYCGIKNCDGFEQPITKTPCPFPKWKKLAGRYLKQAAVNNMLKNGESPESVANCYIGNGGALKALRDCVGFGIELTGRAKQYYDNQKHKLEGE